LGLLNKKNSGFVSVRRGIFVERRREGNIGYLSYYKKASNKED
jgi:hypothetical protein